MEIVLKTEEYVIIKKYRGEPTQSDQSGDDDAMSALSRELRALGEPSELWLVHRLDRVVGGLVVFARSKKSSAQLSELVGGRGMKKEYLECGRICAPHGVRGVLKVESWCDSSKDLASKRRVFLALENGKYQELRVLTGSPTGRFALLSIEGISSREEAQAFKNKILYIHRSDLKLRPGQVLISDMIGLPVIDKEKGTVYGELISVDDGVSYKLYTVKTEKGNVILPGVDEFIKEIDIERGVFVTVIPGFFD